MAQTVYIEPIDFNNKDGLIFKSRIHAGKFKNQNDDTKYNYSSIIEETGWIFQKYSGFAPKKFNVPEKRDFMTIFFDPDQNSCIELKNRVNYYDNIFESDKKEIFGEYDKLYTILKSVKKPQQINELELKLQGNDTVKKVKLDKCKWNFDTIWNYYYDNKKLNKSNMTTVKEMVSEKLKNSKGGDRSILKTLTFPLVFIEDDKEVTKLISYNDSKFNDAKELNIQVFYRKPEKLEENTPEPQNCDEDELLKYYGEPEKMDVKTPEDLDKYYNYNCYIRYEWSPRDIWAHKTANDGIRHTGVKYYCKKIDIIQKPYENNNSLKYNYSEYSFGKKNVLINTLSAAEDELGPDHLPSPPPSSKVIDNNDEDEDEDEDEDDDDDEEEEIITKPTKASKTTKKTQEKSKTKSVKIESESEDSSDSDAEAEEEQAEDSSDSSSDSEEEKPVIKSSKKTKTVVEKDER